MEIFLGALTLAEEIGNGIIGINIRGTQRYYFLVDVSIGTHLSHGLLHNSLDGSGWARRPYA